jgi:NAD(P)-dependent dehydrogenase (short-subunit alcohol dehydrogenase family)
MSYRPVGGANAIRQIAGMKLSGTHVLVFGGSSGIGLGIARAALQRGASVTLAARNADRLAAAATALDGADRVATAQADVSDEAAVRAVLGRRAVDHVVVSTIDTAYAPVRAMQAAAARRLIDSKLMGLLFVAKHAALPVHGSITAVSGIAAHRPLPGGAVVAAVNGALHAFVRALAMELAPVRVNALSPGWVDTPAWDRMPVDKHRLQAERARTLPAGRIGHVDDLGHAGVFLLENGFTTGEVVNVDGGHRFA